jgi:Rho-binding antiterminator
MYHYPIKLTLNDGSEVSGIALDTIRNKTKQECIKIEVDHKPVLFLLEHITTLTALLGNPHFTIVRFS